MNMKGGSSPSPDFGSLFRTQIAIGMATLVVPDDMSMEKREEKARNFLDQYDAYFEESYVIKQKASEIAQRYHDDYQGVCCISIMLSLHSVLRILDTNASQKTIGRMLDEQFEALPLSCYVFDAKETKRLFSDSVKLVSDLVTKNTMPYLICTQLVLNEKLASIGFCEVLTLPSPDRTHEETHRLVNLLTRKVNEKVCSQCQHLCKELQRCGGCKRVRYCSVKCQKRDWINGHKDICGK